MSKITLLALDPALANTGLAVFEICLETETFEVTAIDLIETQVSKTKTVRKNSEDLERARHIYKSLINYVHQADVLAVEIPVGSQTARAMTSYGICIGILSSIDKPLIQLTATQVKKVSGNSSASKKQMIEYAHSQFPELKWLTVKRKGLVSLVDKNEHIADAICAGIASLDTDEFKLIQSSFNKR